MSWRERQRPASFRGVPFFVDSADHSAGRQVVAHEVPESEAAPFTEDMGRKPDAFVVDAHVLGEEYERARDALLAALLTKGPGELVHPYFGTRRVAVEGVVVRQSGDTGGMATFRITFLETSAKPLEPSGTDPAGAVRVAASATRERTASAFEAGHTRAALLDDDVPLTPSETSLLLGFRSALQSAAFSLPLDPTAAAEFFALVSGDALTRGATTLTGFLVSFATGLVRGFAEALRQSPRVEDPSAVMLTFSNVVATDRPVGNSERTRQAQADYDATLALLRRSALVEAASLLTEQTFSTYDAAVAARSAVMSAFDAELELVSDDAFAAFATLSAALVDAVPGPDADLPRIQDFTPSATTNSIVLAWQLYGALDLEGDIVARNRVRHPGFLEGGRTLKVLSNG